MLGFPGGGVLGTTFILGICKKGQWGRVTKKLGQTASIGMMGKRLLDFFHLCLNSTDLFCLLGGRFHNFSQNWFRISLVYLAH